MLRSGAREVDLELVALDSQADRDLEVTRAGHVVLEHVRRAVDAVGEPRDAGPGAPLRIVERLRHCPFEQLATVAARDLRQPHGRRGGWPRAVRAGRRPAAGAGASPGERVRRPPIQLARPHEQGRRYHDSLLVEGGRVGRHAAGGVSADVRVVGAAGGEADMAPLDEEGRDERDVGQVGAAL